MILDVVADAVRDWRRSSANRRLDFPRVVGRDELHLRKTMAWLMRASEHGQGGVAAFFDLLSERWAGPFPETTGYIIPTFFEYAAFSGDGAFFEAAVELAEWLARVQNEDGGCMGSVYNPGKRRPPSLVFNTGQNVFGFLRAYHKTGREEFLASARKAGDFLASSTNAEGVWERNLLRNLRHTINSRTAWALLELDRTSPRPRYAAVARKNLEWVLAQQRANGWFDHGTSRVSGLPNTHFLAYTCEGLLGAHRLTRTRVYLEAARLTADALLGLFESRGTLYAFWDEDWKSRGRHVRGTPGRTLCLSGNAQMAGVWMALFESTSERRYLEAAVGMLDQLKGLQNIETPHPGRNGGLKGSFPVYGSYAFMKYPNWAAKFFADALMAKLRMGV